MNKFIKYCEILLQKINNYRHEFEEKLYAITMLILVKITLSSTELNKSNSIES